MFDKLIVSEPAGADFKNRRKYFMVSSVVVGILFTTAVVVSIFAADYGLGSSSFELVEIIAPVAPDPVEPEIREQRPQAVTTASQNQLPTRRINMARVDEPTISPTTVSTTQNNQLARPDVGRFQLGPQDTNPGNQGGSGRDTGAVGANSSGLGEIVALNKLPKEPEDSVPPPPLVKKPTPNKIVSRGVLNGEAKNLPKPIYSLAAKSVGAQGQVTVQVTIDETGRVISANAVTGHVLLRADAEKAARNARFSPTLLSDVPVKVTGVITYNFIR